MKTATTYPADLTFDLTVEQDDIPVRGNALASGDDALDRECEDEILARLDSGDVWAWACVRVTARFQEFEGFATLGGCCYEGETEFKEDAYYEDLCAEALADLKRNLHGTVSEGVDARLALEALGAVDNTTRDGE